MMKVFKKKYEDYAALRRVPLDALIERLSEENARRQNFLSGGNNVRRDEKQRAGVDYA